VKKLGLALLLALFALPAAGHHYELGSLKIGHIWAGATTPKATIGAAYVPIENTGTDSDVLKGADTKDAEKIEIHESKKENGIAKMRKLDEVKIPAGQKVEFKQGGLHLMLVGLKKQLKAGEHMMITLHFAKAGDIEVDAHVQTAPITKHDHHDIGDMKMDGGGEHEHH
jgi:copper(I)-binding protein